MDRFRVTIFGPPPSTQVVSQIDLNPSVTDLSWGATIGVGWDQCSVGLRPDGSKPIAGYLPKPIDIDFFNHVEIDRGGLVLYAGRITQIKRVGRGIVGFQCKGYGDQALRDDFYEHDPTDQAAASAGVLLRDILGQSAPLIGVSNDPDVYRDSLIRTKYGKYDGQAPIDIVASLSTLGGGSSGATQDNAPYDFQVFADRIAQWVPRTAPPRWEDAHPPTRGAPYWIDLDPDVVEWDEDVTATYGSVTIQYTPPNGDQQRTTAIDGTFQDRFGLMRAVLVDVGEIESGEAEQRAKTELALRSVPQRSVTITLRDGRGLRRVEGGEQPPELIRPGTWVQVADQEPVILLSTQTNATRREWVAQAQNYQKTYWNAVSNLEAMVRAMSLALNPFTSSRTPTVAGPRIHVLSGAGPPSSAYSGSVVITTSPPAIWADVSGSWVSAAQS